MMQGVDVLQRPSRVFASPRLTLAFGAQGGLLQPCSQWRAESIWPLAAVGPYKQSPALQLQL